MPRTTIIPAVRTLLQTSNYVSTPDSPAIELPGDFEIIMRIAADDWTPSVAQFLAEKGGFLTGSWNFSINTTGTLLLNVSANGTAFTTLESTVPTGFTDGTMKWVRVTFDADNGAGGKTARFYTAADQNAVPTAWTQLGADVVSAGTIVLLNSAVGIQLSSLLVGLVAQGFVGMIAYFALAATPGGLAVASFDPRRFPLAASYGNGTTLTAATGEVWTVVSSGVPGIGFNLRRAVA